MIRSGRFRLWSLLVVAAVPLLAASQNSGPATQRRPGPPRSERDRDWDDADKAREWRLIRMRDENGEIPPDAVMRARQQVAAMRAAQARRPSAANALNWTSLGPTNIGGLAETIAIHPGNPNLIFAGSPGGGIWKSTDGGVHWAPVNDFMSSLDVTSIVFSPTNPTVMYAATGASASIGGGGVFKSTDGGTTWNPLSATANSGFYFVMRVAVSPDGTTLLAATISANGVGAPGIYRSTDGGATFQNVTPVGPFGNGVGQVLFDPNDSSRAVAGAISLVAGPKAWYSTDGGATWTPATGLPGTGRVELAYAKSVPNKVYASVDYNGGLVYVSTNGGQSYTLATSGTPGIIGYQGEYDNAIWVDPTNDQFLIVGGNFLYKSTNGGSTFTEISGACAPACVAVHFDMHAIVSVPTYDGSAVKTVFVGSDGGVYKAGDITTVPSVTSWTDLNHGLVTTLFYTIATNLVSGSIVGGTQDNGTLRTPGVGTTWSGYAGDTVSVAHDPWNTNYYYGQGGGYYLWRSSDDGASVTNALADEISGRYFDGTGWHCKTGPAGVLCNSIFYLGVGSQPIVLDPHTPDRLLFGGRELLQTTDPRTPVDYNVTSGGGPSWMSIKPNIGTFISAIAVSPVNSDFIFVGHDNGDVWVTTGGTAGSYTWGRTDIGVLPDRMVTSINFSTTNPNTVWVTFGGYASPNVWKSTNLGINWSPVTGSGLTALPAAPVYDLKVLAGNDNSLYVATDVGLFTSTDGGANWSADGPANVAVHQLAWMGTDTLVAATYGRGVFQAVLGANGPAITTQPQNQTIPYNTAANLSVAATGAGLTYQWYHGLAGDVAHPYAGATSSTFTPTLIGNTNIWCRVLNAAGAASSSTALVTVTFTEAIVPQATPFKLSHLNEVRARVDLVRAYLGLDPFQYAFPINVGDLIRFYHITETQQAIEEAWAQAGMGTPTFSTTPAHGSIISTADMLDLRTRLQQVESVK